MIILGALVNGVLTLIGGVFGLLFKRHVSQKLGDFLMQGLGLVVVLVGIQGMVQGGDVIVVVISIVIGGLVGYWIDIDGWVHRFGDWVQGRISAATQGSEKLGSFSEGFVTSSLFICVGAMAIVGSMQSGLELDHSTLFAKGLIDMVVVMVLASTMGVGVPFSGVCVFVYEALLSLGASLLAPYLTDAVITQMVVVGSLLLLAIGLNMLKVTDIKAANYLPAAFLPGLVMAVLSWGAALL